jgi:hypothetical protein
MSSNVRKVISLAAFFALAAVIAVQWLLGWPIVVVVAALAVISQVLVLALAWPRNPEPPTKRKVIVRAAMMLLAIPVALQLVFGIAVSAVLVVAAFICLMLALTAAWPRDLETSKRRQGWLLPFVWTFGFVALVVGWWNQPWFGANVCLTKGFMWETDFIEEMRPTLTSIVQQAVERQRAEGKMPDGLTMPQVVAAADQAIDLFKQCVAERGGEYCRYVGPDERGTIFMARTNEGPGAIEQEDEYKYRLVRRDINYEMALIPTDLGSSEFYFRMWQDGNSVGWGGEPWGVEMSPPGCWWKAD